jgi:hypothetical protein
LSGGQARPARRTERRPSSPGRRGRFPSPGLSRGESRSTSPLMSAARRIPWCSPRPGAVPCSAAPLLERCGALRSSGRGCPASRSMTFRHSFVAILVTAGCNVREVSEWAGQNNVAFTLTRFGGLFEDGSEARRRPPGRVAWWVRVGRGCDGSGQCAPGAAAGLRLGEGVLLMSLPALGHGLMAACANDKECAINAAMRPVSVPGRVWSGTVRGTLTALPLVNRGSWVVAPTGFEPAQPP